RAGAHAALALHRLDQDRRGLVGDPGAHLVEVAEGDVVEPVGHRRGPAEVLLVARRGKRRQRPRVERALAADDAVAGGVAGRRRGRPGHRSGERRESREKSPAREGSGQWTVASRRGISLVVAPSRLLLVRSGRAGRARAWVAPERDAAGSGAGKAREYGWPS